MNNAYILVYERVPLPQEEAPLSHSTSNTSDDGVDPVASSPDESRECNRNIEQNAIVPVPEDIMAKIWKENREYIVEKHVFDQNYFNFVWRLVCLNTTKGDLELNDAEEKKSVMQAIELATSFVVDIFAHARFNQLLPMWRKQLCYIFQNSRVASIWLMRNLSSKPATLRTVLLYCPTDRVRFAFAHIIEQSMKTLAPSERQFYQDQAALIDKLPPNLRGFND